jgi:hypothetical protein
VLAVVVWGRAARVVVSGAMDRMRAFAWGLVGAGLLVALLWPAYVEWWQAPRVRAEIDQLMPTAPYSPKDTRRIEVLLHEQGTRRAWPSTTAGALVSGFGVLLLAIRRPTHAA